MSDNPLIAKLTIPYAAAIEAVTAALKEEGFGVLTEIDVKKTFKAKIDVDFRPYIILGACNPNLAHRALSTDLDVGLLLPCNVIVYEAEDGDSVVSIIDPMTMLQVGDMPELMPVAEEARARLERVAQTLRATHAKEERLRALIDSLSAYIETYHGGGVALVGMDDNTVKVKMSGACEGCSLAPVTLHGWIEGTVRQFFPEIERVEAVDA